MLMYVMNHIMMYAMNYIVNCCCDDCVSIRLKPYEDEWGKPRKIIK